MNSTTTFSELQLRIKASCKNCSHVKVCAVFRAIAGLLNSFEEARPFEPEDLAIICKEFLSNSEVSMR